MMSISEGEPRPEPTNQELVALAADPSLTSGNLFTLGDMLDQRVEVAAEALNVAVEATGSIREVDQTIVMGYYDVWLALGKVNDRYGRLTGYQRTGCSFGAPVRYRG